MIMFVSLSLLLSLLVLLVSSLLLLVVVVATAPLHVPAGGVGPVVGAELVYHLLAPPGRLISIDMHHYVCVRTMIILYMYVYVYVYIHIYMYIYTCMYVYIYIYIYIYIYVIIRSTAAEVHRQRCAVTSRVANSNHNIQIPHQTTEPCGYRIDRAETYPAMYSISCSNTLYAHLCAPPSPTEYI